MENLTSDELAALSSALRNYIATLSANMRDEPNSFYANENRANWVKIAQSVQNKLGLEK